LALPFPPTASHKLRRLALNIDEPPYRRPRGRLQETAGHIGRRAAIFNERAAINTDESPSRSTIVHLQRRAKKIRNRQAISTGDCPSARPNPDFPSRTLYKHRLTSIFAAAMGISASRGRFQRVGEHFSGAKRT